MSTTTITPTIGMTIAQTINGNTITAGVVTRIAGDLLWVRPSTFNGRPNHRRTYAIHRTFWSTLTEA